MNKEDLLAGYVLGDLTPEEEEQYHALLRAHPELSGEVEQFEATLSRLQSTQGLPEPPSQLLDTILATAERTVPRPWSLPRLPNTVPIWMMAVASLLVCLVGVDSYRLRQDLALSQTELLKEQAIAQMLRTEGTRLVSFRPTDRNLGASGSLVLTPGDKQAVLVLRAVPRLASGQVYRLWAVINNKKLVCGEFTPNAKGEVWVKIPATNLGQAPLIVTLEAIDAPMEATGPMILTTVS